MAPKIGLTPPNPFTASAVPGIDANPFAPSATGSLGGLPSIQLEAAKADAYMQDAVNNAFVNTEQYEVLDGPRVMFSPAQNKMFVNGAMYDADDFQSAVDVDSGGFLDRPTAKRPEGSDWVTVSPETYKNYMNSIEDPSLSRLAARNFSIGGSNLKLIAGRALQFLGAEETGQSWVDSAAKNLYYNQPFQREFTNIELGNERHGAIDWFVANLAQQGPNLLESIAVALAGAGAGALTGGGPNPITATGGAIFALLGKQRVKNEVLKAANKYMKGQALNNGEKKLLRETSALLGAATLKPKPGSLATASQLRRLEADELLSGARSALRKGKQQAAAGGALGLSTLGSYGMGIGDIYGEVRDTGVGDRTTAAVGAIPYAALETLPEFFLASRIFGISPSKALTKGNRLKRAGKGFAVGGTLEGLTEVGQEGILLLGTNQLGDAEVGKRLINSFAAGFFIGGPLGGAANLVNADSKQPVNVLEGEKPADQNTPPPPPAVGEGTPVPDAPPSGPGALPAPATPLALPAPVDPFRGPNFVGGPQGVAPTAQQGELFPDQDLGTQPTAEQQLSLPLPETTQPDRQLTLPLPAANIPQTVQNLSGPETQQTAIGQQLLQAANARAQQAEQQAAEARRQQLEDNARLQRQREFDLAEKARAEQKIQELQNAFAEQVLAENRRLTEQAEQQARQNATVRIPVRPPIQPNLPGISTRVYGPNRLRRGVAAQPVVEREPTLDELEAEGQLALNFTPSNADNIEQSSVEFSPSEKPKLDNNRDKPDLTAIKRPATVTGGRQEGRILDPVIRKTIFDKVRYEAPVKGNILPTALNDIYGTALDKVKITRQTTTYSGGHHNGGVVLQGKYPHSKPIAPNIIAHELGHASHSLLGGSINNDPAIQKELSAIENTLYPNLRNKVQSALDQGQNIRPTDIEFFNYLLSAEELIAEFNVYRILQPEQAAQIAPSLTNKLASVESAQDLVVDRQTFPSGFGKPVHVVNATEYFDGDFSKLNAYMPSTPLSKPSPITDFDQNRVTKAARGMQEGLNIPPEAVETYLNDLKVALQEGDIQEAEQVLSEMEALVDKNRPTPGSVVSRERGTLVTDDGRTLNFVRTAFQQPRIPIGGQNAVQVRSTEEVDVLEQTGTGEGVRGGDAQGQITQADRLKKGVGGTATRQTQANQAKAREALRKNLNQQIKESTVGLDRGSVQDVSLAQQFVDTEGRTPIEMWNELRPVGAIDLSRLPQKAQEKWGELVKNNAVNADIAETVYNDSYNQIEFTLADELAEYTSKFNSLTSTEKNKGDQWGYASQIIHLAFFEPDSNLDRVGTAAYKVRQDAISYLKNTKFTIPQIQRLREVFVEQANASTGETLEGRYARGSKKGQAKPWLDYAVNNNILSQIKRPLTNMPDWYVSPMQAEIQEAVRTETQGDVLGQDTADIVLKTLRQQQKAGQTIDLGLFQEAYYQALGKKGRQIATDKLAELQAENSRLLEDIFNSHLEMYEYGSFRGYNPVVRLTSDRAAVDQTTVTYGESGGSREINRIETIYSNSNKNYYMANGYSLRDFFDAQGRLKVSRKYDRHGFRFVPDPTAETRTEENVREREAQRLLKRGNLTDRERARVERLGFSETLQQMDSKEDGNFLRADGKAAEPLGKGEVKLIVAEVLKKLKVKPKVLVVKDKQELQQQHPEIYARAKAARPRDDFDKVNAMGYSVGDQVIVFSDFIKSKESAQFVVNHEALGHFGFRAFMPRDRMNAIFREIYKTDGHVRQKVDELVEVQGMDQMEAVEEVLADKAAGLDVTMFDKLKEIIKTVLRAFGKTFDDDLTRYFISQSRRNLRTGGSGVVGAQELAQRLKELQGSSEFGRYAIDTERADSATNFFNAQGLNKNAGGFGSFMAFDELVRKGKYKPKQVSDWINESLEAVQTLDNKARRSVGLSKIFQIFQNQAGKTRRYLSEYEALTTFTHTPSWFKFGKGPTKQELEKAGELLAYGALYRSNQVTDVMIKNAGKLAVGTTREGDAIIDGRVRQELENAAIISQQEFRDGFDVTIGEGEAIETQRVQFDATDNEYRIYVENRKAVVQAAIDVLEANILAVHGQRQSALQKFSTFVGAGNATPSAQDIEIFKRIMEEYSNLYFENSTIDGPATESVDKATTFLTAINRALHNRDKVDDWLNGRDNTVQFQGDRYQDIIASIERLNSLGFNESTAYDITNTIQNIFMLDTQAQNAEFNAKRTIMRGYVPFSRRGKWQIRMQAYDAGGKPVQLSPESQAILPYFQAHTEADSDRIAEGLSDITSQDGEDIFYPMKDSSGRDVRVKLIAQVGKARQSQPVAHSLNLMEFMSIASRLDVNLSPQVRQRIVTALTSQSSSARRSLQRSGTPGWDTDIVKSVAEHLETQGHVAGKTQYSYQINDIMLDNRNWKGDPETLARLYNATQQGTAAQRQQAQREYAAYAYKYQYMADKNTPTKAKNFKGEDMPNLGRGEDFRQEAVKLIDWYSNQANIQDSTEDILSGEVGSRLKLYAVLFQLGGSIATAGINLLSMVTHTIPFLGTYNHKTGFGGGFGMPKVAAEMVRATANIGNYRLADYDYVKEMANSASNSLRDKHKVSQDEADALLEATAAGVLQAAQFNALVGTSRGGVNSNTVAGAIKKWMFFFSFTEQLNRRSTYLAAYRLERDRLKANLSTPFRNLPQEQQDQLLENARNFASNAVNTSQGEYAMYNRPEMARGNWAQYIFMYKQFVIISVQLMKHLSPSGRAAMLGMLVLMSGLKGIPFADDLMDLVDTLKQKFGIKTPPIEAQIARLADSFVPGSGQTVLRGFLDKGLGATVSTRVGFGDLIPLTGVFKAKQTSGDYWREATNFFGPVYSGIEGMFTTGGELARYATEKVGLRDDTTRLIDIVRDSPVAAFRGLADGAMYLHDGKITRADGTVIDNDVDIKTSIFRMLGFYPYSATRQNDIIRLVKQQNSYLKAFKSHYTQAYVKARLDNDRAEMRRIVDFIRDHNREHKGTGFEIKNFTQSANKSYKSASKNSLQRFKKFAPKSSRSTIDELAEIMGVELD